MGRLEVVVLADPEAIGRVGADLAAEVLTGEQAAAVVPATGDSPMGLYGELARRQKAGAIDASRATVFQLDEYVGIRPEDPRSLLGWTMRSFVDPLEIPHLNVCRLPIEGDIVAGCAAYDHAVERAGGFDLAILGIGSNGHIGFNEPPSEASVPTREVELSEESLKSSARYWGGAEQVPPRAVTAGMSALLSARRILLVASGAGKHEIVHRALHGAVTPRVPASYLQRAANATVLLDRAAWTGRDDASERPQ